ncbi:hypothetical protein EVAR_96970_1 [Eumeta japonica]|uniref:Uncharacterized protein n=1 Tax=Eumeta variegata TaxID=151549 RepID=A0A4C1VFC9_EUMVA|nr:hypothetical protein EVAR_96970_1 [Eumeta japonica]
MQVEPLLTLAKAVPEVRSICVGMLENSCLYAAFTDSIPILTSHFREGEVDVTTILCTIGIRRVRQAAECRRGVQYNARKSVAVKLVTKALQWRKIQTPGRRSKSRRALNLRVASFAGNSEWQSFVRCTVAAGVWRVIRLQRMPSVAAAK